MQDYGMMNGSNVLKAALEKIIKTKRVYRMSVLYRIKSSMDAFTETERIIAEFIFLQIDKSF